MRWPTIKTYGKDHLARIALPIGGIGTGTVSLGGRGDLRDFEIVNRPAKSFTPDRTFFALFAQPEGGQSVARALEGPLDRATYEGAFGSLARNHGMPRFREARFEAAYPFGQVVLSDPDVPLSVRLQSFNPLIPGDPERSGIPVAILRYVLTNPGNTPVQASICGNLKNFIGEDGFAGSPNKNLNEFRAAEGLQGIAMRSEGVAEDAEQWGTMALATTCPDVTFRTDWPQLDWGNTLLDYWDDFSGDGRLEPRDASGNDAPTASLAASVSIPPREERSVTFLLTWHFPNRMSWTRDAGDYWMENGQINVGAPIIGNYYTTCYADAWDVIVQTAPQLETLERDTLAFVDAFCASDLPEVVKEAALFNLSTLRTQTCFRTPDGRFFGWEGLGDHHGSCFGSCTHVWNYETATAFLFGSLARSMREIEFVHATSETGHMAFRVGLPLTKAREWQLAAADGQMGCLIKLYREWKLSGDDDFLRSLWPKARKALEFCWIPGGWDADQDGVMEGCQHNTMDVEYYGPNPQMGCWYLGALRACEEMARHLGELDFAARCRALFTSGSAWLDGHLFNGDYYEHQIRPLVGECAAGIRGGTPSEADRDDPKLQLGAGCLVDQLVGQYMAHVCGLGYLLDPRHIKATLDSIVRYNFKADLFGHFNHLRTFALQEEAATLMATYPKGRRPKYPFPYYNEVMTGYEYVAAIGLLYEGQDAQGLRLIEAVRARYDGLKRSPFDEAECGHHYSRAMASWSAVLALTGFQYDAVSGVMAFNRASASAVWFWSNGQAWGTCCQTPTGTQTELELTVLFGALHLRSLRLADYGSAEIDAPNGLRQGDKIVMMISPAPNF